MTIFDSQQQHVHGADHDLFDMWQQDIYQNPHFSDQDCVHRPSFEGYSKEFFNTLCQSIQEVDIPDFSVDDLSPVFKLWRSVHKDHIQKGLTSRDTAMLIFSLRNSLVQYSEKDSAMDYKAVASLNKLRTVLDMMSYLTFENYTHEKESVIARQNKQIHYLQNVSKESDFICESVAMSSVLKAVGVVLENDITVLLEGESGTGKDRIAQLIHLHSNRKQGPFITLNCAAVPKELLESELFGHEKGAFTGAERQRLGKFELADGGTLFLDEIGDMPLDMQVKLLRVLQNKEIERVGGQEKISISVRVIAATHKNLQEEVAQNRFRLDLFYRLNVFPIRVPPLRERLDDILPLATFFIDKYASEFSVPKAKLASSCIPYLKQLNWEGNIRELENLMQRAVVLANGQDITPDILSFKPGHVMDDLPLLMGLEASRPLESQPVVSLDQVEKQALQHAWDHYDGNILQTAKALGISRTTFYNKAKKYKLNI